MKKSFVLAFTLLIFLGSFSLDAKKKVRDVTITWKAEQNKHVIEVDGNIVNRLPFELHENDKVLLRMTALWGGTESLDIKYSITGPKMDDIFKSEIKKLLGIPSNDKESADIKEEILPVTDDLLPGGILTVTFKRILSGSDKKEKTKGFRFRIKDKCPWFFSSTGFVFSNENNRTLSIINTEETVTYQEGGKTKQAQQQMVVFKDDSTKFKPKQTFVQFLNFRLFSCIYGSIGFPLNKKIFSEPLLGVTLFLRRKNMGVAINGGIQFHKQLFILESSGYEAGYIINPPTGLTVDNIPTEEKYIIRPFVGLSFKF